MKFKLSARGKLFPGKTHEEIAGICREAGFRGVEGEIMMFPWENGRGLAEIRMTYEARGIRMATFHLPSSPEDDVSSFYETPRRNAVKKIRLWMEKAFALGADTGILHPTTNRLDAVMEGEDKYLARLGKSLEEIIPAAESIGFTLAVENMLLVPGASARFGAFPEHIRHIRENFACENLGFCYDSGHALITGKENAASILYEMSSCLRAFHLQDNAGDRDSHLAPGKGLADWDMIFNKIDEICFNGHATVEAPPFAPGPDYSRDAWKKLFRDTLRLYRASKAGEKCEKAALNRE